MRDFRQIKAWQKSHELVLEIYRVTKSFPREQLYSLTDQTRRAAMSVPTNIAEGAGRASKTELKQFMTIACGSLSEVDYKVLLACDLGYIDQRQGVELSAQNNRVEENVNDVCQANRKQSEQCLTDIQCLIS